MNSPEIAVAGPLYAALKLDALKLLLAQGDICALESISAIDCANPPPGGVGWIEFENGRWPAYRLSDELAPSRVAPKTRRICALINNGNKRLGFLCDDLEIIDGRTLKLHALPMAMRVSGSPVQALAEFDEGLGLVSSAAALAAFVAEGADLRSS